MNLDADANANNAQSEARRALPEKRNLKDGKSGGPAFGNQSGNFAAAFAFATVLALAAHVACLAAALALATVHAFAVMLAHGGVRRSGLASVAGTARDGEDAAGDQSCHGRGND